jgi:hypothetical protein
MAVEPKGFHVRSPGQAVAILSLPSPVDKGAQ